MPDKIDQLYDALKADGAVTKSRENFRAYMQDEQNRRQLYDALKADGAVTSGSFEDFDGRLGVRSVGRTSQGASNYGGGSFGTSGVGTSFGDNDTQRGTKKAYRQVQRPAQQPTQQPSATQQLRQQAQPVQPVRQQPSGRSIYADIDPEETKRLAAAARTDAVKKEAYKRYRNLAFSNMGNNKFNEYDVAKAFNRMWSDPSRVSDKVLEAVWPEMAKAEKKRKADLDNLFNYNYGGMVAEAQGVDKKSVSNEQLMKAGAAYRDAERRVKDEEEAERYKRFLEYFKYSDMPSARKSYEDFKNNIGQYPQSVIAAVFPEYADTLKKQNAAKGAYDALVGLQGYQADKQRRDQRNNLNDMLLKGGKGLEIAGTPIGGKSVMEKTLGEFKDWQAKGEAEMGRRLEAKKDKAVEDLKKHGYGNVEVVSSMSLMPSYGNTGLMLNSGVELKVLKLTDKDGNVTYADEGGNVFDTKDEALRSEREYAKVRWEQEHEKEVDEKRQTDALEEVTQAKEQREQELRKGRNWLDTVGDVFDYTPGGAWAWLLSGKGISDRLRMWTDTEWRELDAAQRARERAFIQKQKVTDDWGFWHTAWDTLLTRSTWDFGISDARDAYTTWKMSESANGKNLEELGRSERMLAEALTDEERTNQEYESTWSQTFGYGAAYSVPLVLEFIATGGFAGVSVGAGKGLGEVGTRMAVRMGINDAMKNAPRFLSRAGAKLAAQRAAVWTVRHTGMAMDDLARAVVFANTTGALRTAGGALDYKAGNMQISEDGTVSFDDSKGWGDAIAQSELNSVGEYFSELLGQSVIDPALNVIGRGLRRGSAAARRVAASGKGGAFGAVMRGYNRMGHSAAGEYLNNVYKKFMESAVGSKSKAILRSGRIDSMFGETLEEYENTAWTALFGDDEAKAQARAALQDPSEYAKTALATAATMGFLWLHTTAPVAGASYLHGRKLERQLDEASRMAKASINAANGAGTWEKLRERIDSATNDELQDVLESILNDDTLRLGDSQKLDVIAYATRLGEVRGFNVAAAQQGAEESKESAFATSRVALGYSAMTVEDAENALRSVEEEMSKHDVFKQDDVRNSLENDTINQLMFMRDNDAFTDEERELASAWYSAKLALEGAQARERDDAEAVESEARQIVQQRSHEDGNVHPVVLKDGRNVWLLSGSSASGTKGDILYMDDSGKVSFGTWGDIAEEGEVVSGADYFGAVANEIQQRAAQAEEDAKVQAEAVAKAQADAEAAAKKNASTTKPAYKLNKTIKLQVGDRVVEGTVVEEENADGLVTIETDVPVNGKRVSQFSPEELDKMAVPEAETPATVSQGTVPPVGGENKGGETLNLTDDYGNTFRVEVLGERDGDNGREVVVRVEGEPEESFIEKETFEKWVQNAQAPEELTPVGEGWFGKIYDQFKGKVKEAFDFLLGQKGGDLLSVWHRDDVGDIDLVWGNKETKDGLEHIIADHVGEGMDFADEQEMMEAIDDVVRNGVINEKKSRWDKVTLEKDGKVVVIRKNIRDDSGNVIGNKNWVVTSFDSNIPKSEKNRSAATRATLDGNQGGRAVTPEGSSDDKGSDNITPVQENSGKSVGDVGNDPWEQPFPRVKVKGGKERPDWYSVEPARAEYYIYEQSGLSEEDGDSIVKANLEEAQDAVKKLADKKPRKGIVDPEELKVERDRINAEQEAAARQLAYWQEVAKGHLDKEEAAVSDNIDRASAKKLMSSLGDYLDFEDFVMREIASGNYKFKWGDAANGTRGLASHTGFKDSKRERGRLMWLLGNKEGKYPEVVAEDLLSMYAAETGNRDVSNLNIDTSDALNVLLEVVGMGSRKDIAKAAVERHAEMSRQESEADRHAEEEAAAARGFNSVEEMRAYDEQADKEHAKDERMNIPAAADAQRAEEEEMRREEGGDTAAALETEGTQGTTEEVTEPNGVDNQGNPINSDGSLYIELVESIDGISDGDFEAPTRNVSLPNVPQIVRDAIGAGARPIIIKKNIFERNNIVHSDLTPEQSREILRAALYNPNIYGQSQKARKPYNWVVVNTTDEQGKNRLVLLEVSQNKDNVEIVHWHYIDERGLEKLRRQAEREDGQLLILPSVKEEVGALSDPTHGMPSEGKGTTVSSNTQEKSEKNADEAAEQEKLSGEHKAAKPEDGAKEDAKASEASLPTPQTGQGEVRKSIGDVGEKIGGARKDLAQKLADRINPDGETFSKVFPKMDLVKLVEQGLDNKLAVSVMFLRHMAQDEAKRQSKGRLGSKQKGLGAAKFFAMYAKRVLETGDTNLDFKDLGWGFTDYGKDYIEQTRRLFEAFHEALGDEMFGLDLSGYSMRSVSHDNNSWYSRRNAKGEMEEYKPDFAIKSPRGVNYFTKEELGDQIAATVESLKKSVSYKKTHPYKLSTFYTRYKPNSYYIAAKIGGKWVPLTGEMSAKEVHLYHQEHEADLQVEAGRIAEQKKGEGRGPVWKPELSLGGGRARVGDDYREGRDISAEELMNTFGFRGVGFGNYVTQGERQKFINESYDAMMDLSTLLGVSPKALSLGGKLGFAIGARGGGKYVAHYEPDKNVINLTKARGAGALAHEWWHALDHYFNTTKRTATDVKNRQGFRDDVREEMRDAFMRLMDKVKESDYYKRSVALERRLRPNQYGEGYYDKPTELAARAFQDWVLRRLTEKGQVNDFLSAFTPEEMWNGKPEDYPYPVGDDAKSIGDAFDTLLGSIKEREGEGGMPILYQRGGVAAPEAAVTQQQRNYTARTIKRLRKAGVKVTKATQEEARRMAGLANSADGRVEFLRTGDGKVYGWHDKDGIHLTEEGFNPDTPAHEYTHGFMEMLRLTDPKKYGRVVEGLKVSETWQEVLGDEAYADIHGDETKVASEVAARLSGRENARRAQSEFVQGDIFSMANAIAIKERVKNALKTLWDTVAEWFGSKIGRAVPAERVARMTLRELSKGTNPDAVVEAEFAMGNSSETFKERQKRAVEQKGVVMPGLNDAEVKVVDVPKHSYTGTIKEATRQAIEAAKAKYVPSGKPKVLNYDNHGAEFRYSITGGSIDEGLSPKQQGKSDNKGVHLAMAEHLDEVIGNSIEVEEHPDRLKTNGERDNSNINPNALMHRFYGVVRVDGTDYRVMTLMREDNRPNEGNGVHTYEVTKIEVLDEETPNTSNGVGTPNSELEAYPLAKVIEKVGKTMEPGKNLLVESAKADKKAEFSISQGFGSAATSLNQVASAFRKIKWKPGTVNVDIGGGRFDKATDYLKEQGVESMVFDPFNRDSEHNRKVAERVRDEKVDTVTCNNVLNLIDSEQSRANVILQAAKALKEGGTAYFSVYEGDKSGVGRQTKADSWQNNRPTKDYVGEVEKYFDDVTVKNGVIIAKSPKQTNEKSVWDFDGSYSGNDLRFREDEERPVFYSNAARAVEGVKQEKATGEQWLAMIKKAGGLKSGEDKWMGLSDWLEEHKGERLTKAEVQQFIADNGVKMEETEYAEPDKNAEFDALNKEYLEAVENVDAIYQRHAKAFADFVAEMEEKYGEDFDEKMDERERILYRRFSRNQEENDPMYNDRYEIAMREMVDRYGDDFKMAFDGGEDGLQVVDGERAAYYTGVENAINSTRLDYTTKGLENKKEIAFVVPDVEPYQEGDNVHFGPENQGKAVMWVRFGETTDTDGNRVLVIDEIQSNRHQDAREKGYKGDENIRQLKKVNEELAQAEDEFKEFSDSLRKKYGVSTNWLKTEREFKGYGWHVKLVPNEEVLSKEETEKWLQDDSKLRSLRDEKEELLKSNSLNDGVPAAPFEKNWHEVAMKRMLRYAAEHGFDKVAWTTGEQQAERYSLEKAFDNIEREDNPNMRNRKRFVLSGKNMETLEVNTDGMVVGSTIIGAIGKDLRDVVGRELAEKMMGLEDGGALEGTELRVGGEGMKGFYDQMLPRFMDKYGKRWGVKTGEVQLDTPGREVMHSVDVTDEMRRSVMEGQPLFRNGEEGGRPRAEEVADGRQRVDELSDKLGMEVTYVDDMSEQERAGLTERQRNAKGWYDPSTGKIYLHLDRHTRADDMVATMLHEAVAHKGLRQMFGKDFDTFLDNVFDNVDEDVRRSIVELGFKRGFDFRVATEEYLAGLAESTDFEGKRGLWEQVKGWFMNMLRKAGVKIWGSLRDEDLRYILWRSYNYAEERTGKLGPDVFTRAKDVALRDELGIDETATEAPHGETAEPLFREDEEERRYSLGDFTERDAAVARDEYERMVSSGRYQFVEAVQDSMLGLKKLYQAILGKKTRIEDVDMSENAYVAENLMSSVNAAEQREYYVRYMKPLLVAISKLCGKNKKEREKLTNYMMAKHGLERNLVLAERDAREAEAAGSNYNDAYAACRERDYAGLTALTGETDVAAAEDAARRIVADYEADHNTSELWQRVNDATSATLEKLHRSGMLSDERHQQISDMFEHYIPLQGWDETTSDEVYGYLTSKNGPLMGSPIKRAAGRSSKADDPIATIGLMADTAIRQGNRNRMKQRFLNFALNHPSDLISVNDLWLQYDDASGEWVPVFADIDKGDSPEEVERKVDAFETRMRQLAQNEPNKYKHGKDAENIPYKVVGNNMREHQVLVKRGGRTYVLTINGNPRAAQALNGLTNPDVEVGGVIGAMLKGVASFNRTLSAFYTTRNPDFVVSNFIRDTLYSNCMTWVKESPTYALHFHKNFGKFNPAMMANLLIKWEQGKLDDSKKSDRLFKQFMLHGGETGYTSVKNIDGHKKEIAKELKRQASSGRKAMHALGEYFELFNRSVENCARFAAFVTSMEAGRSVERSAYDAKEVSVNFNKKGSGSKMLDAEGQALLGKIGSYVGGTGRLAYVFWNAGVQGMTNFGRAAKRHPYKALAGAASMFTLGVVMPMLAKAMAGGDDDDDKNAYYNLPEYIRRSNIVIHAGTKAEKPWITIPLPIEFRAIYGLGELAYGVISGNERYSNSELAFQVASQVSQILPLDVLEGGGGWRAFVPSAVKPFEEALTNTSWTGTPIYKDTPWNKNEPEWTKAYKNTNTYLVGGAKWLNEITGGDDYKKGFVDINPAQVEYMLSGMFGGAFSTIDKLVKMGETVYGDRDFEWRNMLLANRVLKTGDERLEARKLKSEYFKYMEEFNETGRLLKKYGEAKDAGVLKYAEKIDFLNHSPEYARYAIFGNYKPLFDAFDKAMKEAGDEERAELESKKTALVREMVNLMHESEDGGNPDSRAKSDVQLRLYMESPNMTVKKKVTDEIAARLGGSDSKDNSNATEYNKIYADKRVYFDLTEDSKLQNAKTQAYEAGDSTRGYAIGYAMKYILTETLSGKEIKDAKLKATTRKNLGPYADFVQGLKNKKQRRERGLGGLGHDHDDEVMELYRELRKDIMEEFNVGR